MSAEPARFTPVERRTVAEEIRDRIIESIRAGELAPGDRIPAERDLCGQFNVARTSVREAIQSLVSLGYLERRGNRPHISERLPTLADDVRKGTVRELFETRRAIEIQIAEFACRRATPEQRRAITDIGRRFTPGMRLDEFRRLDRAFHAEIAYASGNGLLTELHNKLLAALFASADFSSLLYAQANRREVASIVESAGLAHRAIAAAICAGDVGATVAATAEHLDDVESRMLDRLV